jgi:hypothetical protein
MAFVTGLSQASLFLLYDWGQKRTPSPSVVNGTTRYIYNIAHRKFHGSSDQFNCVETS